MDNLTNRLTKREKEVMELVSSGLSNKEICKSMNIEISTLATYINHIYSAYFVSGSGTGATRVRAVLQYLNDKGKLL